MMSKLAWLFILTAASGHMAPEDSAQCGNETGSFLQTGKSNSFLSLDALGNQESCGAGPNAYPGPINSCGLDVGGCECKSGTYTLSSTTLPNGLGEAPLIEAADCWFKPSTDSTICPPNPAAPPFPQTCKFDDLSDVFAKHTGNKNTMCMKVPAGVEIERSCVKGAGNDADSKQCANTTCFYNSTTPTVTCLPPSAPGSGCSDGTAVFCVASPKGAPSNAGFTISCCGSSTSSTSTESANDPNRTTTASTTTSTEGDSTTTKKKYNRRIRRIRPFRRYRGYSHYS